MVVIFSSTTTLLSTDFVKKFPQELLHAQLYRVGQETGVKFTRTKKTFTIVGAWDSLQKAHEKLQEILDSPGLLTGENNVSNAVSEVPGPIVSPVLVPDPTATENDGSDKGSDNSKSSKSGIPKPVVYFQYADTRFMTKDVLNPEILNRALENKMKGRPLLEVPQLPSQPNTVPPPAPPTTEQFVNNQGGDHSPLSDLDFSDPDEFDNDSDHTQIQFNKSPESETLPPQQDPKPVETKLEVTEALKTEEEMEIKNESMSVSDDEAKKVNKEPEPQTDDSIMNVTKEGEKVEVEPIECENEATDSEVKDEDAPPSARLRSASKPKGGLRKKKKGCAKRKAKKPVKYIPKEGDGAEENAGADEAEKSKVVGPKKKRIRIRAKKLKRIKKGRKADEKGVFPCTECSYVGYKRKHITEHVARKHRREVVNCEICGNSFGFQKDLNRHKKNVHSEPAHFCDVCERFYKNRRVYEDHMKTHSEGYVKPTFTCQICGKSFSTKYVLATHIKSEHLGMKKTYLCPTCGKSFTQRNSYRQHANVHAGIRPHVCDICGMSFTYDKSLKEHKYMHENIRRFQCNICSKAFKQSTSLRIHMKVHSDTKEHMCSACGKGFTQKQALLRHERIHNGDKPYTCGLCRRTFNDTSIIRRHMLLIHKKDPKKWRDDVICDIKRHTEYFIEGGPGDTGRKRKPYQPAEIIDGPDNTVATTATTTTINNTSTTPSVPEETLTPPNNMQQPQQPHQQPVFPGRLLNITNMPQDVSQGIPLNKPRNDQMIVPPPPQQQQQSSQQQHQQKPPQPPPQPAMPINYSCQQQTYPGEIQTSNDNSQPHQPYQNARPDPQRDLFSPLNPLIPFSPIPTVSHSGHSSVVHNEPLRHNQMAYPPVTTNTDMGQPNPWSYPGYPPFYLSSTYPDPTGFPH